MKYLPQKKELMDAIIAVFKEQNSSLSTSKINDLVAERLKIPAELLEIEDASGMSTEYNYRMRWARTQLKQDGLIENVKRGEWKLA